MNDSLTLTGSFWMDVNAVAWVITNLLVVYIAVLVVVFVLGYYILFNPKATSAGKYIFRFFVSLLVLNVLLFVTLFIDPSQGRVWSEYPSDVMPWRPLVRLVGYIYVAYTVTSLAVLLVVRKWYPHKLITAESHDLTIKTRAEKFAKHRV